MATASEAHEQGRRSALRWVTDNPCRLAPQLFHSEGPASQARAKQLCASCPYTQLCLDNALAMEDDEGIWGGTTPEERRCMREHAGLNHLPPASPRRTA